MLIFFQVHFSFTSCWNAELELILVFSLDNVAINLSIPGEKWSEWRNRVNIISKLNLKYSYNFKALYLTVTHRFFFSTSLPWTDFQTIVRIVLLDCLAKYSLGPQNPSLSVQFLVSKWWGFRDSSGLFEKVKAYEIVWKFVFPQRGWKNR